MNYNTNFRKKRGKAAEPALRSDRMLSAVISQFCANITYALRVM